MRKMDWADFRAAELFGMVRDEDPDEKVIEAISDALREASHRDPMEKPKSEPRGTS